MGGDGNSPCSTGWRRRAVGGRVGGSRGCEESRAEEATLERAGGRSVILSRKWVVADSQPADTDELERRRSRRSSFAVAQSTSIYSELKQDLLQSLSLSLSRAQLGGSRGLDTIAPSPSRLDSSPTRDWLEGRPLLPTTLALLSHRISRSQGPHSYHVGRSAGSGRTGEADPPLAPARMHDGHLELRTFLSFYQLDQNLKKTHVLSSRMTGESPWSGTGSRGPIVLISSLALVRHPHPL